MLAAFTVLGLGLLLGLSLAVPPGPILALSADRTVKEGFWPGVAIPLGATVGDGTHAVLMGWGILPLLAAHPRLLSGINVAGGLLMFAFAWFALQGARHGMADPAPERAAGLAGGFGTGYVLALTSPYNFGWWFGVGTALFQDYGSLLFVGFFAGLVGWSFAFVALTRWAHARLPHVVTVVSWASAILLAAFGVLILWQALPGVLPA